MSILHKIWIFFKSLDAAVKTSNSIFELLMNAFNSYKSEVGALPSPDKDYNNDKVVPL